jgi:glycosyltransferase involved in cell wall biosynthesis
MRLTIVQYGGDYREAWERFDRGGKANYQAQRYSVSFVGSLAKRLEQVSIICALTDEPYDVMLPNKVRAIGAGLRDGFDPHELISPVARTEPTRLTMVTPLVPVLNWAHRHRVRTITTLADSFRNDGLRSRLRHMRLAHVLNRRHVEWAGNHGVGACLSLFRIGVRQDKIIPWDWPPSHRPSEGASRTLNQSRPLRLVYVGSVTEDKGVGDLLRALHQVGPSKPSLTIIGRDPDGRMAELAASLGMSDQVDFAGVIPNEDVPTAMRAADAVVIPSRHEYPEGLPLTIYEALAARTPIIASDHPMFHGALTHEENAIVFPAADALALGSAIKRLGSDPELYAKLSSNSEAAWRALQLPVTWGALIEHWLRDTPEDMKWLRDHSLASGIYEEQIAARSVG